MFRRILFVTFFLTSACLTGFGQTSYKGLTPGDDTRADVERVLGQPLREVSATLSEYKSDKETEKIFVQYRRGSSLVERVVVVYPDPVERAAVIRSLNLRPSPTASQTNAKGRFEEYFSPKYVVLTYAAADASGGVSSVGYHSRELFESTIEKVARTRETPQAPGGPGSAGLTLPDRLPPSMTGPSISVTRSGRSSASTSPKEPPAAAGAAEAEAAEKEIHLSAGELRKFVGGYEFIESDVPSLKEARVTLVGGQLKLTTGAATYTLVPIAEDDSTFGSRAAGGLSLATADSFNFKLASKPGVKVSFLMSGKKVENLTYIEEQTEPVRFAVAVPKP